MCVHLFLQQLGRGHVSAALPPGAVEVRPGQDGVEGGRVLQGEVRLHEDLQAQNADKQKQFEVVKTSCDSKSDAGQQIADCPLDEISRLERRIIVTESSVS